MSSMNWATLGRLLLENLGDEVVGDGRPRTSSTRDSRAGSVFPRRDSAAICRTAGHPSLR